MSIVESSDSPCESIGRSRPRVLALEIETEGHHPGYVKSFAEAWINEGIAADLDFLVTPRFFARHADVVEFIQGLGSHGIRIHALSDREEARMERISRLRYFYGWKYFCQYAKRLGVDHGLVMYSDFFQLPIVAGQDFVGSKSPCPFSMIYFRPTFHYPEFRNYRPSLRETLRGMRKKLLLQRVLKNPRIAVLYCLDEIAADYIRRYWKPKCHVQRLTDSFTLYDSDPSRRADIRAALNVEPGRRVMMLMGVLDRRKGVRQLLECLDLLPEAAAKKICVLLVGKVHASHREELLQLVQKIQAESAIQLILRDDYLPDDEVQLHFEIADVILATYQRHMGNSAALIRAAYAAKPVLSADYGLMGEIVHRRKLGETVDTGNAAAMAKALERFATVDLSTTFNADESAAYACENMPAELGRDLAMMLQESQTGSNR